MDLRSALPILLLTAFALTAMPVHAGDGTSPEVVDAPEDAVVCAQAPACLPNQADLDIVAAWVEAPDLGNVTFHLMMAGEAAATGAGVGVRAPNESPAYAGSCFSTAAYKGFRVHFRMQDPAGTPLAGDNLIDLAVVAGIACETAVSQDPTAIEFLLVSVTDGDTTDLRTEVPVAGTLAGGEFTWTVPRTEPLLGLPAGDTGGYRVADIYADTFVTGMVAGVGFTDPLVPADRAPDADFGQAFVFPTAAPPAPTTTYQDVTAPGFTLAATEPAAVSKAQVYNWTVPAEADLDLDYAVAPSAGSVHVVIADGAARTVFDSTFVSADEGRLAIPQAAAGVWRVTVAYDGFAGDLSLGIAPLAPPPAEEPVAVVEEPVLDPVANDQQTGGFELQEEKDAPSAGLGLALLALAAVAVGARRRA